MKRIHAKLLTIFSLPVCFLLMSCSDGYDGRYNETYNDGYESGYSDGYDDGKKDGYYEAENPHDAIDPDTVVIPADEYGYFGYYSGYFDGNERRKAFNHLFIDEPYNAFSDGYYEGYYDGYSTYHKLTGEIGMIDTSDKSEAITEVGFDCENSVLFIRWNQGSLYAYYDVKYDTFYEMLLSDSIGTYANEMIKNIYEYKKIE